MKGLAAMLPANKFLRIHKSYIVATERIFHHITQPGTDRREMDSCGRDLPQ